MLGYFTYLNITLEVKRSLYLATNPEIKISSLPNEMTCIIMLSLEGWDREGGREGDARGRRHRDICICIADSLCYTAETHTPL